MKRVQLGPIGSTLIAVALLSACSGNVVADRITALAFACDTYASTLNMLADLRTAGRLTVAQRATVNSIVPVVRPVCSLEAADRPVAALSAVQREVSKLVLMREKIDGGG